MIPEGIDDRDERIEALPDTPGTRAVANLPRDGFFGPLARKGIILGTNIMRSPLVQESVQTMIGNHLIGGSQLLGATEVGQRTDEMLAALEQAASAGSTLDDLTGTVGQFAPELLAGLSMFGAGRLAARGATVGAAKLAPNTKTGAAVLAKAGEKVTDSPIPTPRIQQVAEVVGGNLGLGVTDTAVSRLEGASRGEALASGAATAAIGTGLEGGLRGVGKLVLRGRELRGGSPNLPESTVKGLKTRLTDVRRDIRKTNKRVNELLDTLSQQRELERAAQGILALKKGPFTGLVDPQDVATAVKPGQVRKKIRGTEAKLQRAGRSQERQATKRRALEGLLDPNPSLMSYVRMPSTVMNRLPGFQSAMRLWHGLFTTPQGIAPKLGPSGFMLWKILDDMNVDGIVRRSHWAKRIAEYRDLVEPERRLLKPAFEAYEQVGGSIELVEQQFGPRLARVVQGVSDDLADLNRRIAALGGQPPMTAEQMSKMNVGNFLPQVHRAVDQGSYIETGAKALALEEGISLETARTRMFEIAKKRQLGPRRFGGIDFQRSVPGTTQQKVKAGVPLIDDPLEALFVHAQEAEYRIAAAKRLGFNNEVAEELIKQAGTEGADTTMLHNMAEHMMGFNYHERWLNSFVRIATNWQAATKMTYAIIPNMFQTLANNPLQFGMRATAKEMIPFLAKQKPVDVEIALGLMDSWFTLLRRSFEFGERRLGVSGAIANFALIPFQAVEKYNRWWTGNAAYSQIMMILARAEAGTLRGPTLDRARRAMFDAGLDLTKIAKAGPTEWLRTNEDALMRAIFKLTQRTQFVPTPSIRPLLWSHPVGRLMFQFGTFALNQGRLMKDLVIGEMGRGNFAPAAYVLAVHPLIGELTTDLQAIAKGRDRSFAARTSLPMRAIEDFANVGGGGLVWGMGMNASFAGRRGLASFAGPTISDMDEFVTNAASGNVAGTVRQFVNLPAVHAAIRLYMLGDRAFEELPTGILGELGEQLSIQGRGQEDAPPLQELQRQRKEQP
jgi:hypothetical protein